MKRLKRLILFKQLFVFAALVVVSYLISSAMPWLLFIGSVSWNLLSF